jgi:hypothetical protein
MASDNYRMKDIDGLKLILGPLPPKDVPDLFANWYNEGFTHCDGQLNSHLRSHLVLGSPDALNKARLRFKMQPRSDFDDILAR